MLPAVVKTIYRNNTAGKEIQTKNQTNLQKRQKPFSHLAETSSKTEARP